MIYTIESNAKEINKLLYNLKSPRYKYISYKNTSSKERLAVMHFNEMKNVKAWYEILFKVKLNHAIMVLDNRSYILLEQILMEAKSNNDNLFLAVKQGSGRFESNITVIINPKIKYKSKK